MARGQRRSCQGTHPPRDLRQRALQQRHRVRQARLRQLPVVVRHDHMTEEDAACAQLCTRRGAVRRHKDDSVVVACATHRRGPSHAEESSPAKRARAARSAKNASTKAAALTAPRLPDGGVLEQAVGAEPAACVDASALFRSARVTLSTGATPTTPGAPEWQPK